MIPQSGTIGAEFVVGDTLFGALRVLVKCLSKKKSMKNWSVIRVLASA